MIDSQTISNTFSALAHPSRVDIFKCLLTHHPKGLRAADLSSLADLPPSTLSHHLAEMEKGRLIIRTAKGRSIITTLNLNNLMQLATLMSQLCCSAERSQKAGDPR